MKNQRQSQERKRYGEEPLRRCPPFGTKTRETSFASTLTSSPALEMAPDQSVPGGGRRRDAWKANAGKCSEMRAGAGKGATEWGRCESAGRPLSGPLQGPPNAPKKPTKMPANARQHPPKPPTNQSKPPCSATGAASKCPRVSPTVPATPKRDINQGAPNVLNGPRDSTSTVPRRRRQQQNPTSIQQSGRDGT